MRGYLRAIIAQKSEGGVMRKKKTAEEKMQVLAELAQHHESLPACIVRAVFTCPYGASSHSDAAQCSVCSRLDGGECVDEFLALYDSAGLRSLSMTSVWDPAGFSPGEQAMLDSAVSRMREWRASKLTG